MGLWWQFSQFGLQCSGQGVSLSHGLFRNPEYFWELVINKLRFDIMFSIDIRCIRDMLLHLLSGDSHCKDRHRLHNDTAEEFWQKGMGLWHGCIHFAVDDPNHSLFPIDSLEFVPYNPNYHWPQWSINQYGCGFQRFPLVYLHLHHNNGSSNGAHADQQTWSLR